MHFVRLHVFPTTTIGLWIQNQQALASLREPLKCTMRVDAVDEETLSDLTFASLRGEEICDETWWIQKHLSRVN